MINEPLDGVCSRAEAADRAPELLSIERHRAIARLLAGNGRTTIAEIARRFGISEATARRDAAHLSATGRAIRTHGGLLPANFFENELHFPAKADQRTSTKVRLASRAAELAPHDGAIFVDAGTTCLEVGRLLADRPNLQIFTNSIPLVSLAPTARAHIISVGGEARKTSLALTGALTLGWLSHLHFSTAVLGASGVDPLTGPCTTELQEASIKAEVLRRSRQRILVADVEKWNRPATVRFAPWSAFDTFVTTAALPDHARRQLAAVGVRICSA